MGYQPWRSRLISTTVAVINYVKLGQNHGVRRAVIARIDKQIESLINYPHDQFLTLTVRRRPLFWWYRLIALARMADTEQDNVQLMLSLITSTARQLGIKCVDALINQSHVVVGAYVVRSPQWARARLTRKGGRTTGCLAIILPSVMSVIQWCPSCDVRYLWIGINNTSTAYARVLESIITIYHLRTYN